ncbi:amino acid ABC transporter permease [Tatumella terrea]|uniref:Amino acid ABC transporter permease n=1 Tax=Tatumella terrea TaxID=419007 RepID=A0ABW1VUY8_9GAMM
MTLDFTTVFSYWQIFLKGLGLTLAFTMSSALLGCILGLCVCLLRTSQNKLLTWPLTLYVEFFRGTPLLIQLFWIFFCLPIVFHLQIPPDLSVLIALTAFMAAITSETFRGALKLVGKEQHDACVALGLTRSVKNLYVIMPQTVLRSIPPLLSNVVSLFKESALISSVGIADLMFVGQNISNSTAQPVEFLTATGVIYFCVAYPLTRLVGLVERRMLKRFAF